MDHDDAHTDRPVPDEGGGPGDLRLGDADRAAALDALGKHLEAGRLDVDEFGERSVHASMAVRCSDLRPLFADLPAPHPPPPRPPAPELVPEPRRSEPAVSARGPQRQHHGLPPALRAGVLAAAVALPVMLILASGPGSGGLLVLPLLLVLLGGLRHGGPGGPGHGHGHGPGRW